MVPHGHRHDSELPYVIPPCMRAASQTPLQPHHSLHLTTGLLPSPSTESMPRPVTPGASNTFLLHLMGHGAINARTPPPFVPHRLAAAAACRVLAAPQGPAAVTKSPSVHHSPSCSFQCCHLPCCLVGPPACLLLAHLTSTPGSINPLALCTS